MIMYMCNIVISLLSQHQSIIYTCIMQSKWCKCTYRFDLLGALQIDFKLHPMKHCVLLEIFLSWVYTLDVIFVSNLFAPFPILLSKKKNKERRNRYHRIHQLIHKKLQSNDIKKQTKTILLQRNKQKQYCYPSTSC